MPGERGKTYMTKPDVFESIELDCGYSDRYKVVIQQKRFNGEFKLDLRFWYKKNGEEGYLPLKKGICVSNEIWREKLLPEIKKYLEKYS